MEPNKLLIILGPTASGKTKLAISIADVLDGEIISADSRQVFSGMDIGTGKDLAEYQVNGKHIPYHLINIKTAGEKYNVNAFKEDFYKVLGQLNRRKKNAVLCGGTGMYIHSLLQKQDYTSIPVDENLRLKLLPQDISVLRNMLSGYPPTFTSHADHSSHKRLIRAIEIAEYLSKGEFSPKERPPLAPVVIGLSSDVALRRERIFHRLKVRLEGGMMAEVQALLDAGVSREMLEFYGLEYKFVVSCLFKELSYQEMEEKLGTAICQFAKRQMTFFRKMEKDGVKIHWFDADTKNDELIDSVISLYHECFSV